MAVDKCGQVIHLPILQMGQAIGKGEYIKMIPLLFNTENVRAILEGRKTVTRRVVKPQPMAAVNTLYRKDGTNFWRTHGADCWYEFRAPCVPGDVLWVRETWSISDGAYLYRAFPGVGMEPDKQDAAMREMGLKWRPSIHMPREAARIFLWVTDVRAERLQEIDDTGVVAEGLEIGCYFDELWDRTIKPADRTIYGWEANPWVWVIEFERISKEEAEKCEKEKGSLLTAR